MTLAAMWKHYPKKKFVNGTGHIGTNKMCEKFGKDHVDANYCFEDCLDDWIVVNWCMGVNR